jgi:hypothetical protein
MARIRYWLDWLFKDLQGRRGKYVIAEVPNLPLAIFMVSIVLALVFYPGFSKVVVTIIAYAALLWWSYLESNGGRSRFRKLLGYLGYAAVLGAVVLRIGF